MCAMANWSSRTPEPEKNAPAWLSASLPGMVLAIALLARLVSWFFRRHYAVAFHSILGFVLASTLVIIPTEYASGEPLLSALCCVGGFLLAFLLARLDKKIQT